MGEPTYDIQTSFRSGQVFNDTDGVINNSYISGVNVRPFGDDLLPRYPYKHLPLTFPSGNKKSLTLEQVFSIGNPQALIPFSDGSDRFLIAIINGTWFRINVESCEVTVLDYDLGEAKLSANFQAFNWTIVDRAVLVFDGDLPVIYNGDQLRRADPDATYTFQDAQGETVVQAVPESTRSCIGAYDNLRLWLGISSNVLAASDEVGSGPPNAPLSFSQSFTDARNFTGQFPTLSNSTTFETITALGTLISQNASFTGKLFAATQDKIYTVESQAIRADWESTPGFITQILDGVGIAGNLAWKNFGYDLLFSDKCGRMNSLFLAQENLQRWSETNISTEVSNYIKEADKELYRYTSIVKFSNLALQTSYPYYTVRCNNEGEQILSHAFKGFLVLSRENLSGLSQPATPVWAGLWEGINPIFSVELDGRVYTLSDDNGTNVLYETSEKIGNDIYRGREKSIRSRVTFGHFKYRDNGIQDKVFKLLDISLADIVDDFKMLVDFKPTVATCWQTIGCKIFKKDNCLECDKAGILSDKGGFLKNYKFRAPTESCQSDYRFRSSDIRLTLEGLWRLREFRLKAESIPDKDTLTFNSGIESTKQCCEDFTNIDDYNIYRTFDDIKNDIFEKKYQFCCGDCNAEEKEEER